MNTVNNRLYTIVIPTRERYDTLEHALRTCVIQDYDNLEIIVSDNFSQDRTRETVASLHDKRIRYINTGKRVSMTENFEFALSHVKPEGYIIFIGDDDGLLPNAINDINAIIDTTGAEVLQWDPPKYLWKTTEVINGNNLIIPSLNSGIEIRDSATMIQNVLSFKAGFQSLPLMYMLSAVSYEVIKKIKNESNQFYHSRTPDVYSGFAIAGAVDNFVHSRRPFAICGISRHSNGASAMGVSTTSDAVQKYLSEANYPYHGDIAFCVCLPACVIECFLQARDHLPWFNKFTLDMRTVLSVMMVNAATRPQEIYAEVKEAVLWTGARHKIDDAALKAIADNPQRGPGVRRAPTIRNVTRTGMYIIRQTIEDICNGKISLDCSSFNVNNVYDACLLCHNIFNLKDMNLLSSSTALKTSFANIWSIIFPRKHSKKRSVVSDNQ